MDPAVDAYAAARLSMGADALPTSFSRRRKQAMNPTVDACFRT
jgi:hypothetical protein